MVVRGPSLSPIKQAFKCKSYKKKKSDIRDEEYPDGLYTRPATSE